MAGHRRPRLWGAFLVLISGVLLASCASSGGTSASGGDGSTIPVVVISDLSGPLAQNGNALSAGTTAVLKSINDAGGINGAKFDVTTIDSMTTTQGAQSAVRQVLAMQPRPAAVILGTTSASLAVVGPMFDAQPGITVLASTILDQYVLPKPASWFFSIAQPSTATADYMVGGLKTVAGDLQGKRVALVGLDNPAVAEGLKAMKTRLEAQGAKVITTEHDTVGMTSFASQAANIAAMRPDGVLTYTSVDNTIIDAQALVTAGVKAPILANDSAADSTIFQKVNAPNFYAPRIYVEPKPGDTLTKTAQKYGVSKYTQNSYFSRGWAIAEVLDRALKACSLPCGDLSDAVEGLGTFQARTAVIGPQTFSAKKHYGADQAQLFAWKDGKATAVGAPIDISNSFK